MRHICILGKLQTKFLAPFDSDAEIWSMNLHDDEFLLPRVDKWFDLHHRPQKDSADYKLNNFPFEACHELVHGRRFCTTTAYLIAFAVLQGATKISIYGVRFTPDGNTRRERELQNVREMLFFCLGKGIDLEICEDDINYLFPEHTPLDGEDFDQ